MYEADSSQRRVSWEEFLRLRDDDRRELIDGTLLETEVPTARHEEIVMVLGAALVNWARPRGATVLASGYKIRISENRGVMPDLQMYLEHNPTPPRGAGLAEGHPDLVVEVLSPSSVRYDRVLKLNWYLRLGVAEYWILDPEACTLERLSLQDGSYRLAEALEGNAVFRPDAFHELEIALAELWPQER